MERGGGRGDGFEWNVERFYTGKQAKKERQR